MELYKGNITIVGRDSKYSLYDPMIASMEYDKGAYDQTDATGFYPLTFDTTKKKCPKTTNR